MRSGIETITPSRASAILEKHNGRNRPMNDDWPKQLASYITSGKWKLTHQGIAFNCDGTLRDGQNRLRAIVLANQSVQMMVTYGVKDDAMDWIDTHKGRTNRDNLCLTGTHVTTNEAAIAKAMLFNYPSGGAKTKFDRDAFREFFEQHEVPIRWSYRLGSAKVLRLAPIKAVLARAWYTQEVLKLNSFAAILESGESFCQSERAAIALRNFCLMNLRPGGQGSIELYKKTQCALSHFLAGNPIKKLYEQDGVLFRIPGDPKE